METLLPWVSRYTELASWYMWRSNWSRKMLHKQSVIYPQVICQDSEVQFSPIKSNELCYCHRDQIYLKPALLGAHHSRLNKHRFKWELEVKPTDEAWCDAYTCQQRSSRLGGKALCTHHLQFGLISTSKTQIHSFVLGHFVETAIKSRCAPKGWATFAHNTQLWLSSLTVAHQQCVAVYQGLGSVSVLMPVPECESKRFLRHLAESNVWLVGCFPLNWV